MDNRALRCVYQGSSWARKTDFWVINDVRTFKLSHILNFLQFYWVRVPKNLNSTKPLCHQIGKLSIRRLNGEDNGAPPSKDQDQAAKGARSRERHYSLVAYSKSFEQASPRSAECHSASKVNCPFVYTCHLIA